MSMEAWRLLAKSASNRNAHSMENSTHKFGLFSHSHNPNAKGSNKFQVAPHLPRTQPPEAAIKKGSQRRQDTGSLKLMPHDWHTRSISSQHTPLFLLPSNALVSLRVQGRSDLYIKRGEKIHRRTEWNKSRRLNHRHQSGQGGNYIKQYLENNHSRL